MSEKPTPGQPESVTDFSLSDIAKAGWIALAACKEANPDNPQKVAAQIGAMVEIVQKFAEAKCSHSQQGKACNCLSSRARALISAMEVKP